MLNNKKIGIRLIAILLTLLMAAAIFAGCSSKQVQADIDAAQSEAEAANKAAADAQAAAISAADAAAALAAQLKAAQDAAAAAESKAAAAEAAAKEAQSGVSSIANGTQPVETGNVNIEDQNKLTELINSTIIGELSQLKVKYLTIRYLWYTESNYLKLAKLFEDASNDIYRATTADGVKDVISKLTTDIAAIPSIMSDAEVIQAQIAAFGDIDTELFTTHTAAVDKARADYSAWLVTYKSYFAANGLNVDNYNATVAPTKDAIDSFALRNLNLSTTTLRYAESKIKTLNAYANDKVMPAAYTAIQAIWGATDYSQIKTKSSLIEDAYALYKIYMVANGGDNSSLSYTDPADKTKILTGEQFVKQYVLVLYDNWFAQYQSQAKAFVDSLPAFFMNNGVAAGNFAGLDTAYLGIYESAAINANYAVDYLGFAEKDSYNQQILNEFEKIVTLNSAEFLKWTYSSSFKGTLSISDAYLQVDNYVTKTLVEMAATYYNKIALPAIQSNLALKTADVTTYANSTDETFKTFDKAFATAYTNAVNANVTAVGAIVTKTYDQLKADTNIEELRVFTANTGTGDVVATYNGAAMLAVLQGLNKTIKEAGAFYANTVSELADLKAFYDFRKDLSIKMTEYAATIDDAADANIIKVEAIKDLTDAQITSFKNANTAIVTSYRNAVMALNYDSYSPVTYQAKDGSKALYYNKAATAAALTSKENKDGRIALNVEVDKLVVAKNAVVSMYATSADQMLNALANLCRTEVNTYMETAVQSYRTNYAGDATVDTVNVKADVENYITYVKTIAAISSIGTFDPAVFSLEKDSIAAGKTLDAVVLDYGYAIETVDTNTYVLHVGDYAATATADAITLTGTTSYQEKATAKFTEYYNIVKGGTDNIYGMLDKVKQFAYDKDAAVSHLNTIKAGVVGTWNATTGAWTVDPATSGYSYDYYSSRKVMYLAEVNKVHDRLVAAVNAITMLDKDVLAAADKLATARAKIATVLAYVNAVQDNKKAADSKDDYSYQVAYNRYYATDVTGAALYDWSKYNA